MDVVSHVRIQTSGATGAISDDPTDHVWCGASEGKYYTIFRRSRVSISGYFGSFRASELFARQHHLHPNREVFQNSASLKPFFVCFLCKMFELKCLQLVGIHLMSSSVFNSQLFAFSTLALRQLQSTYVAKTMRFVNLQCLICGHPFSGLQSSHS
jgi:hypothetical protein